MLVAGFSSNNDTEWLYQLLKGLAKGQAFRPKDHVWVESVKKENLATEFFCYTLVVSKN